MIVFLVIYTLEHVHLGLFPPKKNLHLFLKWQKIRSNNTVYNFTLTLSSVMQYILRVFSQAFGKEEGERKDYKKGVLLGLAYLIVCHAVYP